MSAIQTYFQDFLTNIRLPDNLKKALISAHTELREQLKSDDLTKDLLVESFLQGSYARSTCIKPAPGKKVDVDVIVVTNIDHDTVSAQEAFAIITPFVKEVLSELRTAKAFDRYFFARSRYGSSNYRSSQRRGEKGH